MLGIRLRMGRVENPPMFMPFAKYRIQFVIVIAYLDSNGREQHRKGIGTEPSFKQECLSALCRTCLSDTRAYYVILSKIK